MNQETKNPSAECPACHAIMSVPATLVGKRAACPKCKARVTVSITLVLADAEPKKTTAIEQPSPPPPPPPRPRDATAAERSKKTPGSPKRRIRHFFTKVDRAGENDHNADGEERQHIMGWCGVGDQLLLGFDEDDPDTVKVYLSPGEDLVGPQLGYLPAKEAKEVASDNRRGCNFGVYVSSIMGGTKRTPTRGLRIVIICVEPGVTDEEALHYATSKVHFEGQVGDSFEHRR